MQLVFDFPVTPRYSFDNFVVCSGNRTAFEFARRLADHNAGESVLYVYGPPGSGKSHLLMALGERLSGGGSTPAVRCDVLGDAAVSDITTLVEHFHDAPALLVDDIHLLPGHRAFREHIWHLFNEFYQSGRKIVVTGSVPPRELASVDEHLISRLLWGLVARMDVSDDDSRRLILKKLADDRQIILPDDVIDYLLCHTRRDLHSLKEAFELLVQTALATARKISVRLARETEKRGAPLESME